MNIASTNTLPLIKPMLAVPAQPFDDPDYCYEIKWDGYRCLAYLDNRTALFSRNLNNITGTFPDLGDLCHKVKSGPLVLDGEIIVLRNGKPSFDALQTRARLVDEKRVYRAAHDLPAIYMAFDILFSQGESIMQLPLSERRNYLRDVITPGHNLLISEIVQGEGLMFYRACVDQGLEGVVAKRVDSKYMPGARSVYWKKLRHTREADLVICGYRKGRGGRLLGSLVLAAWNGTGFIYQGMVGSGFTRNVEEYLLKKLAAVVINSPIIENIPVTLRDIQWVQPLMVCRVEFLTITREGFLRHPVYRGIRTDKVPEECGPVRRQK